MLGHTLRDPEHVESCVPELAGLGLLDMTVAFGREKRTVQTSGGMTRYHLRLLASSAHNAMVTMARE